MKGPEYRIPFLDEIMPELDSDPERFRELMGEIMDQISAVKGHRRKFVISPDGTEYRVKRRKDLDYTCSATGSQFAVWQLEEAP